LEL
jgi:transposase